MVFHSNNDCFVHLVAYDLTRTGFSQISFFHFYSPFNLLAKKLIYAYLSSLCDHRLDTGDILLTSLILLVLSNWFVAFWNLKLKSSFLAATNSSFNSLLIFLLILYKCISFHCYHRLLSLREKRFCICKVIYALQVEVPL